MKKSLLLAAVFAATAGMAVAQQKTTITYWQYDFATKVKLVNELIPEFEKANPDVTVKHETFPYDSFITKVTSAVAAGQGPDVVNLFYGWIPQFVTQGVLQPLPTNAFPAKTLEANIGSLIKTSQVGGKYYAVPTAVRTLAVFYNKDLFKTAGITKIPTTWDELAAAAQKIQKREGSRTQIAGIALQPSGQDHHIIREVLTRQFGGKPYTTDLKTISYNSEAGQKAFKYYTDLIKRGGTFGDEMFPGAGSPYRDAFIAGRAGMIIDGSFAIGSIRSGAKFDWGVFPLPTLTKGGLRSNFSSYWVHGITRNVNTPAETDAANRWLKFITSEAVQRRWLKDIGELPANTKLANEASLRKDPVYGPFIASLPFAHATFFADEAGQRRALVDAVNSVWLNNADPAVALSNAAKAEQQIISDYWKTAPR